MRGLLYNVGLSGDNLSKLELCARIRLHVPAFRFLASDVGEDPDRRNYVVDNSRIEATGFRTTVGLDDGIRELMKGYQIVRRGGFANA